MSSRSLVWVSVSLGSLIGGAVPALFGAGALSMAAFVGGVVGSLAGLWAGVRLTDGL